MTFQPTVTSGFLAYQWNVNPRTLRKWAWLKEAKVGRRGYDPRRAYELYLKYRIQPLIEAHEGQIPLLEAKRRHMVAKADKAEVELEALKGSLIPRSQVQEWVSALLDEVRALLVHLPRRVSSKISKLEAIDHQQGIIACEEILRKEIYSVLHSLSQNA